MAEQETHHDKCNGTIYKKWEMCTIIFGLTLANFAAAFDSTAMPIALAAITHELDGTSFQAFWSGTAFLVATTVIQPISCLMSEVSGRKRVIIISLATFIIGSILAAMSHGFTVMLLGRTIQGAGAGSITSLTGVLLCDLIELRQRGKWSSVINSAHVLGTVSGPLIAAAFIESMTWRWIFWINVPLAALCIGTTMVLLKPDAQYSTCNSTSFRDLDFLGIVIFASSLTPFIVALSWGGVLYEWKSWHTIVPLVLGATGLTAFLAYEAYIARSPLIPPKVFANRSTCINYFGIFTFGFVLSALMYYLVLYYEGVKEYSIIHTGIAMLPETVTIFPVGIVVSVLISAKGKYRWPLWFGWAGTTTGLGLLFLLNIDTSIIGWVLPNVVIGLGVGAVYPAIQLGIQASVPEDITPISVTMISSFRNLGRAVGVAVGGVVLQNRLEYHLRGEPLLEAQARQYSKYVSTISHTIMATKEYAVKNALKVAVVHALTDVWQCLVVISGLALISSLFVLSYNMDRKPHKSRPRSSLQSVAE